MKKSKLKASVVAVSLALSVTTSTVMAENDPFSAGKQAPNLSVQEKVLFSLNETSVSIVAAIVDAVGCSAASGNYSYTATSFFDGHGTATLDDYTINAWVIPDPMNPGGIRGTRVDVSDDGEEEIGDVDLKELDGTFWYSKAGEIMYSDALFMINPRTLAGKWEDYDEHVIKDYYWTSPFIGEPGTDMVGGVFNSGMGGIRDAGLEVITKKRYPRAKWREISEYLQPNGVVGKLTIVKHSIAPENAPECKVEIFEAAVIDFGDGLQLEGKVSVSQMGFGM